MKQHLTETDSEDQSVLARLWHRIGDRQTVTQECAQAMFIGNESLLSNMSFLLHFMINNPEYITRLRAELDTLDIVSYSYKVWRDPKVLQLGLLVSTNTSRSLISLTQTTGCALQRIYTSQFAIVAPPTQTIY